MSIILSDQERGLIVLFEEVTGASARDCVVVEDENRVVFVVEFGDMATAIGPDGRTVRRLEDRLGRTVELIEHADAPGEFVANALSPAAVMNVRVEDGEERVAFVDVPEDEKGTAIGSGGRNITMARRLANRHHDIDDIRLT